MTLQYSLVGSGEDQTITVFVPGEAPLTAGTDHVNFDKIVEGARNNDDTILDLFDTTRPIERATRLSDRVSVRYGKVYLDNDEATGVLQDQILRFVENGEDFQPLVNFYERLVTNPLGDVRETMYAFIQLQEQVGNFTITPEGKVLGYKSVHVQAPEWREDVDEVFVPSRRGAGVVNGHEVQANEYIEQLPGDIVEMPRSRVLHAPSVACADGLHIGTWGYIRTFLYGHTKRVMLVEFDPRDVVSVPNTHDAKIRVCRYKVIGTVVEPISSSVFDPADLKVLEAETQELKHGDYVSDGHVSGYVYVYDDKSVAILDGPDSHALLSYVKYGGRNLKQTYAYGFRKVPEPSA